jgi:signal transduction histidine kinase
LNVQAGALRRLIPRDPPAADELVVELCDELRSAIVDIRHLVYDLRPPALDDLGLLESLRQLAERYGAKDEPLARRSRLQTIRCQASGPVILRMRAISRSVQYKTCNLKPK